MDQLNITSQNQFRSSTPASSVSASNSSVHSPRTTPGTPVVFSSPPPQQQHQQQQQQLAHSSSEAAESEQTPHSCSTTSSSGMTSLSSIGTSLGGSPPKLTRERVNVSMPPRRRLFSRPDEEPGGSNITTAVVSLAPPRDSSGLRSSSETSVFDFRDSDSESEMPVLERQTLDEMRRDRKSHTKHQAQIPVAEFGDPGPVPVEVKEEIKKDVDQKVLVSDPLWANMCDDFVEELKHGANRVKRWVRLMHSKTSPFVETVSSLKEENISIKVEIKEEKADSPPENQDDACECKPEEKEVVVKHENNAKVIVQNSVGTQNVIVVNNDILKNESAIEIKTSVIKKELTAKNDGEATKKVKTDKKEKLAEKKEKDIYNKDSVCDKKGKQLEEKEKFTEKKEKSCDKGKALDKSKVKTTIKKEKLGEKEKKRKQDDSDEDLPLVRRSRGRPRKKSVPEKETDKDVEDEISLAEMKARLVKVETYRDASIDRSSRSEGCDSDCDEQAQTMARRLRHRKCQSKLRVGMKLRSKDSVTPKKLGSAEKKLIHINKKNQFGDMSDFQRGWEEEVYSYKRSLRMPPKLISIPRPSNRLCSSLPDLDAPLHSPAASTLDSFDFSPQRRGTDASNLLSSHRTWSSVRSEMADSDLDSNSNFSSNWSLPQRSWNIAPDSEEASSSTTFSTKNKCKISDNNYALLNRIASKLSSSSAKDKSSPEAKDNGKNSPCIFTRSNSNTPELLLRNDSSNNKSRKPNKKHTFTKSDGKEVRRNCLKEGKKVCDSEDLDLVGSCKKDKNCQNFNNVLRLNSRVHAETDVCVSRTRGRTRVLCRKATIRAVFGADRPASAPPTCREDRLGECCVEGDRLDRTRGEVTRKGRGGLRNTAVVWNSKTVSGSKRRLLLTKQRHSHSLLKILSPKKLLSDGSNILSKNSPGFGEGDVGVRAQLKPGRTITGKRIKLRTVRRKFRSGFDYIRKKKKQQKKDGDGDCPKEKKKNLGYQHNAI
ncbi:hypothetical protein PR048_007028 [Dryococelus australis]|uniref:Uncharacterized protein n=1 Tax=Dryococelus australis TaxID=614101 RepID=A0ABQ9ICG8_9NEOP|nr:hypothetical protein PR048_007028 [Dryococelus australis]